MYLISMHVRSHQHGAPDDIIVLGVTDNHTEAQVLQSKYNVIIARCHEEEFILNKMIFIKDNNVQYYIEIQPVEYILDKVTPLEFIKFDLKRDWDRLIQFIPSQIRTFLKLIDWQCERYSYGDVVDAVAKFNLDAKITADIKQQKLSFVEAANK